MTLPKKIPPSVRVIASMAPHLAQSNDQIWMESMGDDILREVRRHFAGCRQLYADQHEREERWLTFWAGQQ